jgi:hypothetical protein
MRMLDSADARRRWWGLFCLTLAAGLLVWGQTVLRDLLIGWWFLAYWAVCFACTASAILIALLDLRALRRRLRRSHADLVERALDQIEEAGPPPSTSAKDKTTERKQP